MNWWNLVKTLLDLWPLWVILLAGAAIRLLFDWFDLEIDKWRIRKKFKQGERWRSDREMIDQLFKMTPGGFEDYIAGLFDKLGYKTTVIGGPNDGGIDVIAEKKGIKHYIQCKKYFAAHEVGVGALRDFYGAIADRLADGKGFFVTTSKFTLEAERFAEDKPIELIDGQKLVQYVRLAEKQRSSSNLQN